VAHREGEFGEEDVTKIPKHINVKWEKSNGGSLKDRTATSNRTVIALRPGFQRESCGRRD